ncbi:Uncharacterized protein FWK35_00018048 [Aphis craccivora]|uniref:DUF4806 domain-containing protein n=1 Tax=Aphis craccivora TaxID=307492 RepID=A0A6G0YI07_APHCR|nr:Uncharacterized protein FWK35_00018048 [Aphis craccivora]
MFDDNNEINMETLETISILDKSRSWLVKHNVSHRCVNSLLRILKTEGLSIPNSQLIVGNMLLPVLEKHNAQVNISDHIIKVGINIDGLPIAKRIYHGFKKTPSIEEFLKPIISDLMVVLSQSFLVKGTKFKVQISNIVCDAPAKAFLLNVKGHNSYFGCTSCTEEGTY